LRTLTLTSLAPLALPGFPSGVVERLVTHLRDPNSFGLPFPVPSCPANDPAFNPGDARGFIWRGPSWVNTNWLIAGGLRLYGIEDLRTRIADQTCDMIGRSGFREYYHPYSGQGYGARDFSWSTLLLDMLQGSEPASR
jgi:hypothetical protein